jgi:hypothetical protein
MLFKAIIKKKKGRANMKNLAYLISKLTMNSQASNQMRKPQPAAVCSGRVCVYQP